MNHRTIYYVLILFLFIATISCNRGEPIKDSHVMSVAEDDATDSVPEFRIPKHDSLFISKIANAVPSIKKYEPQLMEFYTIREFRCGWFNEYGLTEQASKVVNLVTDYLRSGIVDSTILIDDAVILYRKVTEDNFTPIGNDTLILQADILFTAQFFVFADKAWKGLDAAKAKQLEWYLPVARTSFVNYMNQVLVSTNVESAIKEPVFTQYVLLKEKLKLYSEIRISGGWGMIPFIEKSVLPGDTSFLVPLVKQRLKFTLEYRGDSTGTEFDRSLAHSVSESRKSYGLADTPLINLEYISALNISVDQRLKQMLLNLERWKWVPPNPAEKYIVVNIPEFMLHVIEKGDVVKSMKVIVGKSADKTVVFNGNLMYVVFSPYWIVPRSIIVNEILPAVKKNRNYLLQHHMEVVSNDSPPKVLDQSEIDFDNYSGYGFPYSIRQKPGPMNSLGLVKFLFPNEFSIYLHDTPARNLFEQSGRTFSHGCIRIEQPQWLAGYLLRSNAKWSTDAIEKAMLSGIEKYVTLKEPVPVYITYFTSWVDTEGKLHFRNDVYGHDRKLELMMKDN